MRSTAGQEAALADDLLEVDPAHRIRPANPLVPNLDPPRWAGILKATETTATMVQNEKAHGGPERRPITEVVKSANQA